MSDKIENTEDFILWRETLDYVTDKNVVDMLVQTIRQLRAKLTLMHQTSDERDEAIIKEVALDCALMSENDYSTADVAIEIRKKYGLERIDSDRFCLKEVDDE